MSTRAQVRFATREEGVSFSEFPDKIHAQFYVNCDGYPEDLGLEIAESLFSSQKTGKINNWEIEDLSAQHSDLEYIYYIWQHIDKSTWISIFKASYNHCPTCGQREDEDGEPPYECVFVGEPITLQDVYRD